jgi:hypothetical protein
MVDVQQKTAFGVKYPYTNFCNQKPNVNREHRTQHQLFDTVAVEHGLGFRSLAG